MSEHTNDIVDPATRVVEADSPTLPIADMAPTEAVGAAVPVDASATDAAVSGPRIRWAGVIWGLAFAVVGFVALRMLLTPAGRDAVYAWTVGLTPLSIVSTVVLGIGGLLVLTGLVGLAHRLQQGRRRGR